MPDLVSVLIPVHNAERWLADSLRSALAQTWRSLEIVVADDGSSDHSLALARTFEAFSLRVPMRVLALPHRGAAAARNAAMDAARGDWLQFLDADDQLAPDKIEQQMAGLARDDRPAQLATSAWADFYARPGDTAARPDVLWQDLAPADWLRAKFEHNAFMFPATWLVHRGLAERAGRWDEALSLDDDGEYLARLVRASDGVRFVAQAMSHRRIGRPGSLSSQRSPAALQSAWRSMQSCLAQLRALDDGPRSRAAGLRYLQDNLALFVHDAPALAEQCRTTARALGGELQAPRERPHFEWLCRLVGRPRAQHCRAALNRCRWGARRWASRLAPDASRSS